MWLLLGIIILCLLCLVIGHFNGAAKAYKAAEDELAELRGKVRTYESEALAKVPASAGFTG